MIVGGILYRKTYALIDCDVIKSNIEKIRETYNDYKYYFGVVKANAYGHGIYVINAMIDAGINYLAVATLEEALNIRKLNKKISVLVLEPIDASNAKVAALNNITITIDDVENFKNILNQKVKLKFHMKIDTGMNRFGLKKSEDADYIYYSQLDDQLGTEKDSLDSQLTAIENEISSLKTLVNNNIKSSCTLNLVNS